MRNTKEKGYAPVKKNSPRKGRNTFKFGTFAGEMVAVQNLLDEAFKKVEEAEKEADKTHEIAEAAQAKVIEFQADQLSNEGQEKLPWLEAEAWQAAIEAKKAFIRAAKARAKAQDAEQNAVALGIPPETDDKSSSDGK